jgi:hypothetical protein
VAASSENTRLKAYSSMKPALLDISTAEDPASSKAATSHTQLKRRTIHDGSTSGFLPACIRCKLDTMMPHVTVLTRSQPMQLAVPSQDARPYITSKPAMSTGSSSEQKSVWHLRITPRPPRVRNAGRSRSGFGWAVVPVRTGKPSITPGFDLRDSCPLEFRTSFPSRALSCCLARCEESLCRARASNESSTSLKSAKPLPMKMLKKRSSMGV